MSRILRRPMFRGGRVSSYGTGIAHGLADGGMPPKRGLVTGPGGYQGDWNWKGGSSGNITTGKEVVDKAAKTLESRIAQKARNFGRWFRNPGTGITGAIGRNFPTALRWGAYGLPVYGALKGSKAQSELIEKASEKGMLDEFGESVEFADGRILPSYEFAEKVEPSEYTVESGLLETDEEKEDNIERKALQAMTSDEAYKLAEKKPGKIIDVPGIDDDDPTALGESDLASMVSRYEDLLGAKKAKGKDISDMLLRFAGAEGDTTMEKFQKFAAKEADIPGRTEKIKQAAAMLGIKYEQAKDIAAITALGKRFSPGITEKTAKYIKSLPKGSAEHATALAQIKWPSTLDRKITEAQMTGNVTLDDINVWAGVYIDNYKGKLTEDSVDGVFLNTDDSTLIWVDENGVIGNKKQLNVK